MRTPQEWAKNLENGTITEEMLDAALYSVNKRAKNCRDQKREYSHRYDKYHNAERYEEKESEYYSQKEKLLSALQPMCIHRETLGFEKIRHYDNKPGFSDTLARFYLLELFAGRTVLFEAADMDIDGGTMTFMNTRKTERISSTKNSSKDL